MPDSTKCMGAEYIFYKEDNERSVRSIRLGSTKYVTWVIGRFEKYIHDVPVYVKNNPTLANKRSTCYENLIVIKECNPQYN